MFCIYHIWPFGDGQTVSLLMRNLVLGQFDIWAAPLLMVEVLAKR